MQYNILDILGMSLRRFLARLVKKKTTGNPVFLPSFTSKIINARLSYLCHEDHQHLDQIILGYVFNLSYLIQFKERSVIWWLIHKDLL